MARTGQLIWCGALLLLLALLPRSASAATNFADEGSAYSACMSAAAGHPGMYNGRPVTTRCTRLGDYAQFTCYGYSLNGAQIIGCMGKDPFYVWPLANSCEKRPDWNGAYPYLTGGMPKNGSVTCNAGCKQAWYSTGDGYFNGKFTSIPGTCNEYDDQKCKADFGAGYYFNQGMSSCEPEGDKCPGGGKANSLGQCKPEPCPSGMTQQADGTCKNKDNECPAGQVKSPDGKCLPGEGQCAAGEARGKDGTCKRDSNNDGEPDEGEEEGEGPDGEKIKESFSGGDDCNAPPSCSGSPVLCGMTRIQWRIDCNTRKNRNIAGGSCAAMPVCTGEKCDAVEYSGLLMQWRTACAVEKLAGQGSASGQPEWTKVGGMSTDPGVGASPDDTKVLTTKKVGIADLDQSGIGGGGSCVGFAPAGGGTGMSSGFLATLASPPAFFCQYIAWIKAVIVTMAAAASAIILARGGN